MRVVCQQPNYFPWAGYFEQIAAADVFIYLDSVQWIRQGRQHRTRLPGTGPAPDWLTVPVHGHGHRTKPFREILVDHTQDWPTHHWNKIRFTYQHSPFFHSQLEPILRPYFEKARKLPTLYEVCQESVSAVCDFLGLDSPDVRSSDLPETGEKSARLISLCQEFSADEYYSALGATRYIDLNAFRAAGIRVRWQHFRALRPDDPLRPADLSILDWLANVEKKEISIALEQLRRTDIWSSDARDEAPAPRPARDVPARSDLEPGLPFPLE